MDTRTFDLNRPDDAKAYIRAWVDLAAIASGEPPASLRLEGATDEDHLLIAKQLFLYCDPRAPLGSRVH